MSNRFCCQTLNSPPRRAFVDSDLTLNFHRIGYSRNGFHFHRAPPATASGHRDTPFMSMAEQQGDWNFQVRYLHCLYSIHCASTLLIWRA